MSLIPLLDLKEWLNIMDELCQRIKADALNGIIINPESVIPADFPELRFEK